ncbi:uncharacterized protein LOC6574283 isoform X1 [Drosophila mojavensis]|uniref:Uncharacterized protein n=2 Tax=Drosophila mojavensis TaxID=7230 RepID=B4KBU7_DROMO|nr:uncharacterized protein LOC6574283 isoform X1 [Drosophila mojavensis]EDW15799.1 uncharacterized protein Dmoj_GI22583 [Drosophila mojavensis]
MAPTSINSETVILTEVVRQQYVRYLERQLQENVCVWAGTSRNHHKPTAWACIDHSVKAMETHAIKACQAAQLYQRAMVKMIAAVRRNTRECRLADALFDEMQQRIQQIDENSPSTRASFANANAKAKHQMVDKATQTTSMPNDERNDSYTSYTLCQKIDMFQSQLAEFEGKEHEQQLAEVNDNEMPVTPTSSIEDVVGQELAKLFNDEPTDLSAVFGIAVEAMADGDDLKEPTTAAEQLKPLLSPVTPSTKPPSKSTPDLRNSLWPCELYAQRRRLNACLVQLLDADWRCEDALRYKFHMLFGEDSDDEFATQISSPSIDLVDEVLLASCILRIRPWIVRYLMRPLQEGLIANRFLFKKLAKMLANNIVLANPYASERQVKQAVEYVFCIQPRGVQSALDLELMPPMLIERDES